MNERRAFNPFRFALFGALLWSSLLQFAATAYSQASNSKTQPPWQESRASAAKGTRIKIPKILRSDVRPILKVAPKSHLTILLSSMHTSFGVNTENLWCFAGEVPASAVRPETVISGLLTLVAFAVIAVRGATMRDFGFSKATTNQAYRI